MCVIMCDWVSLILALMFVMIYDDFCHMSLSLSLSMGLSVQANKVLSSMPQTLFNQRGIEFA